MFYDIFSSLCIIHKTTPAAVAKELEITNAAVSKWRQGAIPRDFTLRKIADYFDVTVDYLLEEERKKTFWENYSKLCSERGESPNSIAAQLGYSSGSVTAWKQGRVPKYQTLEVIAKHFGVSVEYLLKEQENKPSGNFAFKENFIRLCNERHLAPTAVCKAVGLSNAVFTAWDENSVPRQTTLIRIADYFGVTVDYLLGKEKTQQTDLIAIQQAYSRAPEEIKIAVRKLLDI